MKRILALLFVLAASGAQAATVNNDLEPAKDGDYRYTPPKQEKRDGVYVIEIYDANDDLYARVWNTAPTLDKGHKVDKYEIYYPSGALKSRTPLNDAGQPDGEERTFDKEGNLAAVTPYKNGQKDGTETWYWIDGKKRAVKTWKDGVLNGPWQEYYKNGELEVESTYVAGGSDGVERKYYENGQLSAEVHWSDGKRDGPYMDYDKDGNLLEKGNYVNGVADGDVIEYFPSGERRAERHYVMGRPTGSAKRWMKSGQLVSQTDYADDGSVIKKRNWSAEGELTWLEEPVEVEGLGPAHKTVEYNGNMVDTEIRADGYLLRTVYVGDTLWDRVEMVDGKYQGLYVSTTRIDQIKTRVHFIDGEEDGLYTRSWRGRELDRGYYDHGKRVGEWRRTEQSTYIIKETYNDEGKLTGEQRSFRKPDGKLMKIATYKDGTLDGPYKEFKDDRMVAGGLYVDGVKEGKWLEKIPFRETSRGGTYDKGRKQGRWKLYDGNGYPIAITTFKDDRKDGPAYILADNGALEEVQMWKDNKREGYVTYYDDKGPVSRKLFRDGRLVKSFIPVEGAESR